jgi:transcription antitermination factor NusG
LYWICVSIQPHFLQLRGEDQLGDLFFEIFGDDYLEHYVLDYDEIEKNNDLDKYAFVHCQDYQKHINTLRVNRYIKNVLNSFNDVVIIPEEEVLETKSSVQNIIQDDDYYVNRTGFFMFGDIVRVTRGSLSSMNGIVIERIPEEPDFYTVYFRLFVHRFYRKIHISNMEFHSSIFKYVKIPIQHGQAANADKRIKKIIKFYNKMLEENAQKKLVEDRDVELEIKRVTGQKKPKRGVRKT